MNNTLNTIVPSASMNIGLAEGTDQYLNLAIGSPDLPAPPIVQEILQQGIVNQQFEYVQSKGSKKAISNLKMLVFPNSEVQNQELMLVNGAKYGIYLSLKTICNPGDTVILMEPFWLSYPSICYSLNLNFKSWLPKLNDYQNINFDFSELETLVERYHPKILILNNPNNPSGKIFDSDFVAELNSFLSKKSIYLLIDEVYKDLAFSPLVETISNDNIVRVGSLSKSLSVPGLRIGYIRGQEKLLSGMQLFNQHLMTCINSLSHYLIEHLPPESYHSHTGYCTRIYQDRFEKLQKLMSNTRLRLLQSQSSFYALIDFSNFFEDGQEAAEILQKDLKLLVTPGRHYGESFRAYIRVCLTHPTDKLSTFLQPLAEKFKK